MKSYLVWCPEEGETEDGAKPIQAWGAEMAAMIWVEKSDFDSAEYCIAKGGEAVVFVRLADKSENPRQFKITGEFEPIYYVDELK